MMDNKSAQISQTVIIVVCCIEILLTTLILGARIEHPLMYCPANRIRNNVQTNAPFQQSNHLNQEQICSTHSTILSFAILHLISNLTALVSIKLKKYRLLLPFLFLAGLTLAVIIIFIFSALFAYFIMGHGFSMGVIISVLVIFVLKVIELRFGQQLYQRLILHRRNSMALKSSILSDDDQFQL